MALRYAANKLYSACGSQRRLYQTAEETWAKHVPKNHIETPAETKKNVQKEMIGFLLLGPVGAGLMIYDFIWGLEEHSDNIIPPYPWMRIRRVPGMPWGDDALFEYHRYVASEWPLPEGHSGKVDLGHHH